MERAIPFLRTPWLWEYFPVKKQALLGPHNAFVTNMFSKRTPSWAILSMFGVFKMGFPAQLIPSHRWSSVIKKTKLGFRPPFVRQENRLEEKIVPRSPAEEYLIKSLLVKSWLFFTQMPPFDAQTFGTIICSVYRLYKDGDECQFFFFFFGSQFRPPGPSWILSSVGLCVISWGRLLTYPGKPKAISFTSTSQASGSFPLTSHWK